MLAELKKVSEEERHLQDGFTKDEWLLEVVEEEVNETREG